MSKILFTNKDGKTILLDGSTTVEQLVELGVVDLWLAAQDKQLAENEWSTVPAKPEESLLMVSELIDVPFPACSKRCSFVRLMGTSECENMCTWKFNSEPKTNKE